MNNYYKENAAVSDMRKLSNLMNDAYEALKKSGNLAEELGFKGLHEIDAAIDEFRAMEYDPLDAENY